MIISDSDFSAKNTSRGKRVFLSNAFLSEKAELAVHDQLAVTYKEKSIIMVRLSDFEGTPDSVISVTPSGKRLVVDLHNKQVAKSLGSDVDRVRICIDTGKITIHPTYTAQRKSERIEAAKARLRQGQPLRVGEVCHGVGGLGLSVHEGMTMSGVSSRMAFANDYDIDAMEASVSNNPLWDKETIGLHMSLEQIDPSKLSQIDMLIAGLSCKGASRQSRTGRKLSAPEYHPEAGFLMLPFFSLIASSQLNPLVVLLENVLEYFDSVSAHMLTETMSRLGYVLHEIHLSGQDYGALENRKRGCMLFVTEGMNLDVSKLADFHMSPDKTLGDVIDHKYSPAVPSSMDVPQSERNGWYPKWRLLEREQEAIAKGAGHRAVIADPTSSKVSTLTASLGKGCRLDEAVVESECGNWVRLFSKEEHAAIKDLPAGLVNGVGKTIAHKLLGNSVVAKPWRAVGYIIGLAFQSLLNTLELVSSTPSQLTKSVMPIENMGFAF